MAWRMYALYRVPSSYFCSTIYPADYTCHTFWLTMWLSLSCGAPCLWVNCWNQYIAPTDTLTIEASESRQSRTELTQYDIICEDYLFNVLYMFYISGLINRYILHISLLSFHTYLKIDINQYYIRSILDCMLLHVYVCRANNNHCIDVTSYFLHAQKEATMPSHGSSSTLLWAYQKTQTQPHIPWSIWWLI